MSSGRIGPMPARSAESAPQSTLVLVRHGESEGNRDNVFTGWLDKDLTERGKAEARAVGAMLVREGFRFRSALSSALTRARRSAEIILHEQGENLPVESAAALNERDYGELAGLDKDAARRRWGEEQVRIWRRSYDVAPPGGESLRDTAARVLPFYIHHVLPAVMGSGPVLVVAHGHSIRALVMALDGIRQEDIPNLEIATGEALVYRLHADTSVAEKVSRRVGGSAAAEQGAAP